MRYVYAYAYAYVGYNVQLLFFLLFFSCLVFSCRGPPLTLFSLLSHTSTKQLDVFFSCLFLGGTWLAGLGCK